MTFDILLSYIIVRFYYIIIRKLTLLEVSPVFLFWSVCYLSKCSPPCLIQLAFQLYLQEEILKIISQNNRNFMSEIKTII